MHQHPNLEGVVRFFCKPKPIRLLGSLFLCALTFLPFSSFLGQERVIQRVTAPLQSVLSPPPKASHPSLPINSRLPGLGTLSSEADGTSATPSPAFAGSLELLSPQTAYLPSIYVEGQGYVPLSHPSIQPYIDPALFQHPESDPSIVMIPGQVPHQMETTGKTTLSLPPEKDTEPIVLSAQTGWCKRIGNYDVYFLQGDCSLRQGTTSAQSPDAVVWIATERDEITHLLEITLYLESNSAQMPIRIEQNNSRQEITKITDQKWFGHWYTRMPVDIMIARPLPPQEEPAIFKRAIELMASAPSLASNEGVTQTQYLSSTLIPQISEGSNLGFRRISLNSRGDTGFGIAFEPYPHDPSRGIFVLTGGINLIVEGIADNKILTGNTVDISADNVVLWTENPSKIQGGSSFVESDALDFEIYLEGNIVYRDGPRVIEASRMYYDAKHKVAYILNGKLSAPISEISGVEGSVRLKAEILRQMGDGLFSANNAMVTTSQLGEPTYSLRSRTLTFDRQVSRPFGGSESKFRQVLVAENNYVTLRNVPVFYWPWMATDVEDPTLYIKNFSYGNSGRNGHTIKTLWNPFQILNCRRPDGVDGDVNLTWMEKRGINYGADFQYNLPSFCSVPGQTKGTFVFWGLHDRGTDQLGGERKDIGFPHQFRHRLHWVHQQQAEVAFPFLGGPWDFRAEVGKVSDRNLMNSHFNSAWHTEENATTAIDLKRQEGNKTISLSAEYALDNCYSNANWLPRLDHFLLGQSIFSDYLTWYEHTRIGLMDYHTANAPSDPTDENYFRYLPWEFTGTSNLPNSADTVGKTGIVFSTRHELDLPIQAGVLRIIPYVLGDFSVWGQDQTGNAVDRLYGQGGVRLNVPFWKVNPKVSSRTWYLNGLAHKIDLDAEYLYAQANHSMDNLILTDPLDHWSIDDFRRRYLVTNAFFNAAGQTMLPMFDPRYYALRSGLAGNVTAGNMEIADDMQMLRLGMTHRFQTKRGSVGKRHILDWITFSTHLNLYPQTQHNFGQTMGLFDYNFLWHVGDRFSLFSEGIYDFFDHGQNLTRVGGVWNRPDRGSFSVMVDQFSGVVERTYLTLSIGYTMSEKYSMSYMTSYDIRDNWRNVGHNFMFVRTGESFRLLAGAIYSEALSEWSFSVGFEPVFLRSSKRNAALY